MNNEPANRAGGSLPPTIDAIATDDAPTDEPEKIGRYRVVKRIGVGSFGRVYLAFDDDLNRPVAIKVPHRERIVCPRDIEIYLEEARVLALLDHPAIVPVYDFERTEDGYCFIVSKFIEGTDLARTIKEARPSHVRSAELVADVAEALHYAHTRGFVHRDIKPSNLLLDSKGKPHVADFGLALKEEDFGKRAGILGTPAYMSPEQAVGGRNGLDGRSDIFSLGVVFYELLAGRRPFRGDTIDELLEQITTVDPRPLRQVDDTIPKELQSICHKAISKRVQERYSTAKDMSDEIRHFLDRSNNDRAIHGSPGVTSPEPSPSTISPDKNIRIEGTFKLRGCLVQFTVTLALLLCTWLLHISARRKFESVKAPLQPPGTVLTQHEAPPSPRQPSPPDFLGEMVESLPNSLLAIISLLVLAGFLWFSFKLLVFLFRPVFARRISETDEDL